MLISSFIPLSDIYTFLFWN